MCQRQPQRGARDAIADRVDLRRAGDLAHLGHRGQKAVADIIVQSGIGIGRLGIDPTDDKHRKPLPDQPFDQAVGRFQVQHVEFVDPRRKDQQRGLVDRPGCGSILDQLEQMIAKHHRTRRGGDIDPHRERLLVGQSHLQIAIARLDVTDQILQPLHQRLAIRRRRLFQSIRIGAQKVRGREHVDDLLGEILDPLALARLQPRHILHRIPHRFGIGQVLLLEIVERRIAVPQRVGKAAVRGAGSLRRLELALHQSLLRRDIMLQRLAPIADLMFQNLRRILHHFSDISRRRLHVDILVGAVQRRVIGLARRQCLHQPRRQRLYFCQIVLQPVQLRVTLTVCGCHIDLSPLFSLLCSISPPDRADDRPGLDPALGSHDEVYGHLRPDGKHPQHQ